MKTRFAVTQLAVKFCGRLACVVLISLSFHERSAAQSAVSPAEMDISTNGHLDRAKLEAAGDQVEALAGQMLELSHALTAADTARVAGFFADPAWITPLPPQTTELVREAKWVQRHAWPRVPNEARSMSREEIVRMWDDFLAHFSELEDVRFKVGGASFDEDGKSGVADLEFYLIGRDPNGLREWARGTASVTLEPA